MVCRYKKSKAEFVFIYFKGLKEKPLSVADPGFSSGGGAPTPKGAIIFQFFAENCMKMKEFGPRGGGGGRVPGAPLGSANACSFDKNNPHFG